jgi:hypothetical protein
VLFHPFYKVVYVLRGKAPPSNKVSAKRLLKIPLSTDEGHVLEGIDKPLPTAAFGKFLTGTAGSKDPPDICPGEDLPAQGDLPDPGALYPLPNEGVD